MYQLPKSSAHNEQSKLFHSIVTSHAVTEDGIGNLPLSILSLVHYF